MLWKGDSEDLEDCFPPPPLSFQSDHLNELEDLQPTPPPQQVGKVSPSILRSFQPVHSFHPAETNLHERKIILNQKQYSQIERNIANNDHFSITSSLKTSTYRIQMKSPSFIPLLTPPITHSDNMHDRLTDETDIDI